MPFFSALLFLITTNFQGDSLKAQKYFETFQSEKYSNPNGAIAYLDSAIFLSQGTPHKSQKAHYLRQKGIHLKNQGELAQSLQVYDEALGLFEQENDSAGIAATYNNIGISYFRMANYDLALANYFKARDINLRLQDNSGLARNYIAIGNLYADSHQYEEGLLNYLEAEKLLSEDIDASSYALVTKNIGLLFSERDNDNYNPSKAIEYGQRSILSYRAQGDSINIAGLYHNLGLLYENEDDLGRAENYYRKGLKLREAFNLKNDLASSHFNLGNVSLKKHSPNEALLSFLKSYELASESENLALLRTSAKRLSEIYSSLNVPNRAFRYLTLYDSLDEILFNTEKARIIGELETKYETERKEKELAQAQTEIERRIAERNGYLITLAVFLSLTILLVLIYQQRQGAIKALRQREKDLFNKKVNELLLEQELTSLNAMLDGQENERKRLSRELHDRIGSLLTAARFTLETNGKEQGDKLKDFLAEALEETRNLSHSLASGVLAKFGLVAAINDLKASIEDDRDIQILFNHEGLDTRINNEIEIDTYRIIQELISNSLKHSFAKKITIFIAVRDQHLELNYRDDGVGFIVDSVQGGIGLKNVEARSKKYNGQLSIDSRPAEGMLLTLNLEIYPDEKAVTSR
ncbi:tetratricopeptide repeat protein [Imperialibacter roseus]|uniref:histidine kinase n=1 Tax=Imperialibacter roseus TaxID=1324217 RepID=A0ABZ0IVY6_9BACT|nr:tetratricopeptide repeat protein [Imperialibacter roseus]WOK09213.1 tetratricopeptide repeat protein [Imperialibacter roseus]